MGIDELIDKDLDISEQAGAELNEKLNNDNGEAKQEVDDYGKCKQKQAEYIQKISKIAEYPEYKLVESIIIASTPKFLISDGSKIEIKTSIELESKILKPFNENMYMNKTYSFESEEQVKEYIEKAKSETLDTLYRKVKTIWMKYIDADNFHISICSADTIFSYLQDRIGLTHYLFFVGSSNSGKSNNLTVFQYLAYRNMTMTGLSYANIYQFLGSGEEGIGTICEDEADTIDLDNEKMKIYKNGYTTGRPTSKIDLTFGRKQLKFNNFCWKAFSAERLPDVLKAQGFNQRIIEIFCTFGIPQYDISEVVNPAGETEFQNLLDELNDVRNTLLIWRMQHYTDPIPDIKLNLVNREKQLFKPIIRVFQNTRTLGELLPVISNYVSEKREKNVDSYHSTLYRIIKDLVNTKGFSLESMEVINYIRQELELEEFPNKPQSFESQEFGTLSIKGIIKTLKEVFGVKKDPSHNNARGLIFDPIKLGKLEKLYDVNIKVEIKEGSDTSDVSDTSRDHIDTYCIENNEETEHETNPNINKNTVLSTCLQSYNASNASNASYLNPLKGQCVFHDEIFGDMIFLGEKINENITPFVAENPAEDLNNNDLPTDSSETVNENLYCSVCRYKDKDAYSIRTHFENAHVQLVKEKRFPGEILAKKQVVG